MKYEIVGCECIVAEKIIGIAEINRFFEVTEFSAQNFECWDSPSTLVFAGRQCVRQVLSDYWKDYYGQFHDQMDYCLHTLFE